MRTIINPESMYSTRDLGFSHAARHSGADLLFIAGQVAWNHKRELVGKGDLKAQMTQALKNISEVLATQNASAANIVRLHTYLVDPSPENVDLVCSMFIDFFGSDEPAPNTLIGVTSLASSEFLIEIEATASL